MSDNLVELLTRSIEIARWRKRVQELITRKAAKAKRIPVTPKRAGGGEVCGGPCGQPMIAGSIGLHRNLLCGECRAHDFGNPMAPREPVTDDEPHAA